MTLPTHLATQAQIPRAVGDDTRVEAHVLIRHATEQENPDEHRSAEREYLVTLRLSFSWKGRVVHMRWFTETTHETLTEDGKRYGYEALVKYLRHFTADQLAGGFQEKISASEMISAQMKDVFTAVIKNLREKLELELLHAEDERKKADEQANRLLDESVMSGKPNGAGQANA